MAGPDFLPMGLSPYVSPEAAQLLSNPVAHALLNATYDALDAYYTLQPVGSETQAQLRDRIAIQFVQQFSDKWQGPITADAVASYGPFKTIVTFVSPMSRPKTAEEAQAYARSQLFKKVMIGGAIVAGAAILYVVFMRKKGRR